MNMNMNDGGPGPSNAPGPGPVPAPGISLDNGNVSASGNNGRNFLGLSVNTNQLNPNDHHSAKLRTQSKSSMHPMSMTPVSVNANSNQNHTSNTNPNLNVNGVQSRSPQSVPATSLQNLSLGQTQIHNQNQAQGQIHTIRPGTRADAAVGQNACGPIDPRLMMSHPAPQHPPQQLQFYQVSEGSDSFQTDPSQNQGQIATFGGQEVSRSASGAQNTQGQFQSQGQAYGQDPQYSQRQFRNVSSGSQNSQNGQMQMQAQVQHPNCSQFVGNTQQFPQPQRFGHAARGHLQAPQGQMAQFSSSPGFGQMQQSSQQGPQQDFSNQHGLMSMNQNQMQNQNQNQTQLPITMGRPISRASTHTMHNDAVSYPTPESYGTPASDTDSATFLRDNSWLSSQYPSKPNNVPQYSGLANQPNAPRNVGMFSNAGVLQVPRSRPHLGASSQQFAFNPQSTAFSPLIQHQYHQNPYHARVSELGGSYNIPGIDHLGYFLQPLGWQPDRIPVDSQGIIGEFNNTCALIDIVIGHAHDNLASAPEQNPAAVLENVKSELVRVFDIVRHERQQVRQEWEFAQQNRPFVFEMLQNSQQQSLMHQQRLLPQSHDRENQAARNRQISRVQQSSKPAKSAMSSGRPGSKLAKASNKRRRSDVSDVSDAETDGEDEDAYEPSVGPASKRARGSRNGRDKGRGKGEIASTGKGKSKAHEDNEDVSMDEDQQTNEDDDPDNPEPQRNWYRTTGLNDELDGMDGPLPMMMPTPQNLRAAGLSFDRMNPSAVRGGKVAIDKLKKQEETHGGAAERSKKVRKGRTAPPTDGVPITNEMAESLKTQFPNLAVVNANGSRRT